MKHLCAVFLIGLSLASPAYATQVQEVVTPGGIKAWLVEEHGLPLLSVKIVFTGSGSAYDPKGKEGLASMTTDLLLEGAGSMDSQAFNKEVDKRAIQLGFTADEDTLRASMETLSEHKDAAFSYLGLALTSPRFDATAIERVRSQTLTALKEEEKEPGYLLHRKWQEVAYGDHPYGRPAVGTQDSISAITKEDLGHFAYHSLARNNMIIAVVGDITPADLASQLDKNFATLNANYEPATAVADVRLPEKAQQVVVSSEIPQTMVLFGENGLKREDPDYYAAFVMNHIIGGGGALTSRLGIEIREKRGLAYGVGTDLEPMARSAAWMGSFATRNDQVGAALKVLRETLKDFAENGPTDAELEEAKKHITGSFVLGLDSNGDIANFLINMQMYHLGRDYFDKRNALMMAVHKEDVKKMAAKLVNPDKLLVVMVGKPNLDAK